jgi:predicted Zn-dependent peptidase
VKLLVEPSRDVPLVWYEVVVLGGAAGEPAGKEGLLRCAAELARRGAGTRTRAELDRALDDMGSSVHVTTTRDRFGLSGVCLARNLEATIELVGDVLGAPTMSEGELTKLLVDTRALLDEVRDDDGAIAQRFFVRDWAGDHPYSRTALGTEASLAVLPATWRKPAPSNSRKAWPRDCRRSPRPPCPL